jgi:hypothetical protein
LGQSLPPFNKKISGKDSLADSFVLARGTPLLLQKVILNIIEDAFTRRIATAEACHSFMMAHVGLREVLIKAVRIVEVIGFMARSEGLI